MNRAESRRRRPLLSPKAAAAASTGFRLVDMLHGMSFFATGRPRAGGVERGRGARDVWLKGVITVMLFQVFVLSAPAAPGLTWRWSNPLPHGNNIVDMTWDGTTAVQVTDFGQIYTGLGFYGWLPRESGTPRTLQAVRFFGKRIVFVGANGTTGYSDDGIRFSASSLNTTDWLVDLAVSSNLCVAVGDNAVIFSSVDGARWSFQTNAPGAYPNWLLSVAWGAGMFVTTGEGGYVATSPDGTRWTARPSGVTSDLTRVAWVENTNGQGIFPYTGFWSVSADGKAIYSLDRGATWQSFSLGTGSTNILYCVTANADTGLVAGDSELRLGLSPGTWVKQTGAASTGSTAPAWTYYTALWDEANSAYRVAGDDGMMVQGSNTNQNYSWDLQYLSPRDWLWQTTVANELYVAVGDNARVMTSPNGVDWTIEAFALTNSIAGSASNTVFLCVGGDTNMLLAAGNHGSLLVSPTALAPVLVTNLDGSVFTNFVNSQGLAWYALPAPTTKDLDGTCAFNGHYYLVGAGGTVLRSADATNWSRISVSTTNYLSGLAASTNLLVATGDHGIILTSPDGQTWTKRTSGTSNWLFRARRFNGVFLATGENGTLLKSTNGLAWSALSTGTTNWLNDVTVVSNSFYLVGNNGTVLASTNLVNWDNLSTITGLSLYGAATQNGQLVTVGLEGTILRSQVIPDRTPIQFLSYGQLNDENVFVVAGHPDQQFTLDSSTDLTNWTTGPILDLIYGSGTLLFFTPAGTNPPPTQFFRATLTP